MTVGSYDLDGKCTVCSQYAPCSCEVIDVAQEQEDKAIRDMENVPDHDTGYWDGEPI